MTATHWTPEEIAALVEGWADAATRERLECAIATEPEARRWFDALRQDRGDLDAALHARFASIPAGRFAKDVLQRLPPAVTALPWRQWLGARWRRVALVAALVAVGAYAAHSLQRAVREGIFGLAGGAGGAGEGAAQNLGCALASDEDTVIAVGSPQVPEGVRSLSIEPGEYHLAFEDTGEPFSLAIAEGNLTGRAADFALTVTADRVVVEMHHGAARLGWCGQQFDLVAGQVATATPGGGVEVLSGGPMPH